MACARFGAGGSLRPSVTAAVVSTSHRIEEMRSEARYARERYDLYRAKMYGMRPTSASRLRELERIHQGAEARLRRAEQEELSQRQAEVAGAGDGPAAAGPSL